jgi:toxin-antitoxin system PIN domain toxin
VKYLLDVNALIALIWASHVHHAAATAWRTGKQIVLCPITELGFVRISTSPTAFNATMTDARQALADFIRDESPEFIPADARALEGDAPTTSGKTTDFYLANLAARHGLKLATFDAGIQHTAVALLS